LRTRFTHQWPGSEIEAKLHLNDAQRATLQVLQDATAKAADMLKVTFQPDDVVTPPARLAALAKRLDTMLCEPPNWCARS